MSDDDLDPEQAGLDHHTPADLLELYEVLEWQDALGQRGVVLPRAEPVPGSFVPRALWGARLPRGVTSLRDPAGTTWHYEGPRMGTFPHSSCFTKVRGIQAFHMDERGWTDIAYNHVVCPHGVVFEGRGRDARSAANGTNTGNSSSHAVCALTGVGDPHPPPLFVGLMAARAHLMGGGTGPRTWGHRDWKATSCPGDPIYQWFRAGMPTDQPPEEDDLSEASDRIEATLARVGVAVDHLTNRLNHALDRLDVLERRTMRRVRDPNDPTGAVYLVADGAKVHVKDGALDGAYIQAYRFPVDPEPWTGLDRLPTIGPEASA